ARGTERFGLLASSGALRLRPCGMDVRHEIDPVDYFLNPATDVRSSYHLEDVATEFDAQGLELDWAIVGWDADLRLTGAAWSHHAFRGTVWQAIRDTTRQRYLKNAYRVLLTRARQGMIIYVPTGVADDVTRAPALYDGTYGYLRRLGLKEC
ncbi:MAG: DNA/RNA helicase domain-containing protein, partial [Anaerolineae bacterium]